MTQRFVIVDDASGQELAIGTVYYNVEVEYTETDQQFNTGIKKYLYKDSADWNAVGVFIDTGLPANSTRVTITRKTVS